MIPLTLSQVRVTLLGHTDGPAAEVRGVSTDTRTIRRGSLFVALRGENFDGHAFLEKAQSAGAVAAVVDAVPPDAPADLPLIVVPDTRVALGRLANHVRRHSRCKAVIAVAGSNGKTGTKLLIHAALRKHLRGTVSPKSYNNDIGVPLTLLAMEPDQDYVVVECGTNHPGEIANLSRIAEPDIAVITNCGPEHLEGLGDLNGVRRENASIVAGMKRTGRVVLNNLDPWVEAEIKADVVTPVFFGLGYGPDVWTREVTCDFGGVRFLLDGETPVHVPLLGRHVASNALAAIAVARELRVPEEAIIAGLAEAKGPEMRLDLSEANGVKILNDAYNANPASVAAALETLRGLPHDGRKVAVLGDMLELGPESDRYHREAGELAAACGFDLVACVGPRGRLIADAAGSDALHFADATLAADAMKTLLRPGDLVLLKASRGVRLETVAAALSRAGGGV